MTLASEVLADSPYLYWRCDETSGTTAADSSGNARDGTISGDVKLDKYPLTDLVRDPGGRSFMFNTDGTNGQILHAATGWPTTEITAEMWIDSEISGTAGTFSMASATYSNNFLIFLQAGTDDFSLYVRDATIAINNTAGFNHQDWIHFVVTWRSSDGRVQVWQNGVMVRQVTLATGLSMQTSGQLLWGQEQDTPGGGGLDPNQVFHGRASNLAIYPTVLSDARIVAHYDEGKLDPTITGSLSPVFFPPTLTGFGSVEGFQVQDPLSLTVSGDPAPPAPTVLYPQRIYDTVLADWVYYTLSTVTASPAPGETIPSHTGNLDATKHEVL